MCHHRCETLTRRSALALLLWAWLSTVVSGCSPAGRASDRAGGTGNRLEKMRALRGTGDPRRPDKRPSIPASPKFGLHIGKNTSR
jgi:hypothetical protein